MKQKRVRPRVSEELAGTRHWVMLGKLASGIVHEINNPLDGVINCLQQVRSGRIPAEKQVEYLELAEEQLLRIGVITKRLLGLSRGQAFVPSPCDINDLLEKALFFVDYRMKKRGVSCRRELAKSLPRVSVDQGGVLQIVTNLYLNAIDSMGKGGVLTVGTGSDEKWVRLSVSDTGTGIPDEVREHVFDPFFTTKKSEGGGLGLSICLSIIEQHGGEIELETAPGEGTKVTVRLPRS